ncbi:unnamed protein product [Fusarium graminearum]|nr:unnamed protein product [Fusarium graminearum]
MAELALAIIPIGIKVCTGLVEYLRGLEDRSDALNRLTRQAESLEGSFLVLDTFMKRGQLDPTRYEAVTQIGICLKNCEEGLKELTQFEQSQKAQNRLEHGIQKLCFPLRKAHLEQLETTLDYLCQPLSSLAIQNLQLRAKPTDVNEDGMSYLHMLARAMNVWHWENSNLELYSSSCLESLFNFLIATGTPAFAVTSYGQLALHIAAYRFAVPASILSKLCGPDDVASASAGWARKDLSLEWIVEYYRENLTVIEYLFAPLSRAIILGNQKMAEQLIDRCPECLEEISFYGETPIYLAVENPEMMKLIVSKSSPAQLVQSNLLASAGYMTPLGRAMKISGKICKSQQTDDGSNCPCIAAAEMLLNADCPVIPDRDFAMGPWDENLFSSASKHCKGLVAQSLRTRRRELDKMARQRLLNFEYSSFSSSAGELDFYAVELDLLLRRKQRASFGRLSTIIPDETGYVGVERPIYNPIFLFLSSPEDATIFLDLGFLDIDPSQESSHADEDYFDTIKYFLTYISPQENPHGLILEKDERMWEEVETSKDDYEKAVYLNDFVTEFEDFMLDSSEDASTEEHSDELRKVDYRRALVFWNEIRPKRIREIKKSLAETWDPDLETLQDLGVTLWYEEEGEDDTASETSEDERARYFGKFLKDLENI